MKKILGSKLILFAILLTVIGTTFNGCNSEEDSVVVKNAENNNYSKIETDDYSIIKENGSHYIVFANQEQIDSYGSSQLASLEFVTMQEFKDAVTKGLLEDWQIATIANAFSRNEVGVLCCDFNSLYTPILPTGGSVTGVSWVGESYSFYLEFNDESFGFLHYYTATQYDTVFQSQYVNYFNNFNNDAIHVESVEQIDNGQKNVTYYSTFAGELMQVRYTLEHNSNTLIIDKTFRLDMSDETINVSNTVPSNITMYCQNGGVCYVVDLYGLTEDPSDEWLVQFGMKRYVDQNEIDK